MTRKRVYIGHKGDRKSVDRASRPKQLKRPLNVNEKECDNTYVSASAKKIKDLGNEDEYTFERSFGYRIIEFFGVFTILSNILCCKTCHGNVSFSEESCRGLGFKLVVKCHSGKCPPTYINSCPLINNRMYDINRRIILAFRLLGIGLRGIIKFCGIMELPRPVFQSYYSTLQDGICAAAKAVAMKSMKEGAKQELEMTKVKKEKGICVSGDGSWQKRGFSSLFGFVSLIAWHTGKVIDILVKSRFCQACSIWSKKKEEKPSEYEEWAENHAAECLSNHEGSSGKMEVDAVVEMFSRSKELHDVEYPFYVGDGDSKTMNGLLTNPPYKDVQVEKRECIDHVQKRMGTRLRNLKKVTKGLGGKDKLTNNLINDLTLYYGMAIRRNCNESVAVMKKAVWATLYHKISTDEKPQHQDCPVGKDSWCKWQKAKANNELQSFQHKKAMKEEIFEAIKPVYEDLTREDLLSRCMGGYTQNSNESFNSVVWNMAPKHHSNGKIPIDIAAYIAVCTFNDGYKSIMKVMEVLGLKIGENCYNYCLENDDVRIQKAESSLHEKAKEARKAAKATSKKVEASYLEEEGEQYGAGIAD